VQMGVSQVRVAKRRLDALVASEHFHRPQRCNGHQEATRKPVPEVVPAEVRNLSLLDGIREPMPQIPPAWPFLAVAYVPYAQ